jgi:hypothetical protein
LEDYYQHKEYRNDIIVEKSELYYEVHFFTQSALEYEMTKDGYFALPGLIILDNITTSNIKNSLLMLDEKGFFENLKGMKSLSYEKRFMHAWYFNEFFFNDVEISSERI